MLIATTCGFFTDAAYAREKMLLSEKMLPADTAVAMFVRDGSDTLKRWERTALYEVLQMSEMKEMLAPLKATVDRLLGVEPKVDALVHDAAELLKGELGVGFVVSFADRRPDEKPLMGFQAVLGWADPQGAKQIVNKWVSELTQIGGGTKLQESAAKTVYQISHDMLLAVSFADAVTLISFYPPESAAIHDQALGRMKTPRAV